MKRLFAVWQHFLFRSIVLLALLIIAIVFGTNNPQGDTKAAGNSHSQEERKKPDERVADYTWWLNVFTAILGGVAAMQVYFLKRTDETARVTAEAALQSANSAKEALILGQRAWVTVEAELGENGCQIDALGVTIAVKLKFNNVGNAIALKITPNARVFPSGKHGPSIVDWQNFIDTTKRQGSHYSFYLVPVDTMPNERDQKGITIAVSAHKFRDDWIDEAIDNGVNEFLIGGCVVYTFPSDNSKAYHTGFFLHLSKKDGIPFNRDSGKMSVETLVLSEDVTTNFFSMD